MPKQKGSTVQTQHLLLDWLQYDIFAPLKNST
jgi:hypothetical protein